jgi:hypothetical protein
MVYIRYKYLYLVNTRMVNKTYFYNINKRFYSQKKVDLEGY